MSIQIENAAKKFDRIILAELTNKGIHCWVAGGALRDHFMGLKPKTDIDIFFASEDDYTNAFEYLKEQSATVKHQSKFGVKVLYKGYTFDLIKKYFDSPHECINAFDFTVSMFATDGIHFWHGETSFIDLSKRQLMFNEITYPASTMRRAFRYYQKGFRMCKGEMKKLVLAINEFNFDTDPFISHDDIVIDDLEDSSSGDMFNGID